jgi:predicted RND superfamily exporter protein
MYNTEREYLLRVLVLTVLALVFVIVLARIRVMFVFLYVCHTGSLCSRGAHAAANIESAESGAAHG